MCVAFYVTMIFIFRIYFLVLIQVSTIHCHVPDYASTPSNKVEQYCIMAETCVHDTIPICGSMGDEKRSFLDLCDLLEYVCDTMQIFSHIEDVPGCPAVTKPI